MKYLLLILCIFLISCDGPKDHKVNGPTKVDSFGLKESKRFKKYNITVMYQWLSPLKGSLSAENKLMIYFYDKNKELVDLPKDILLEFYATMPSMGHPMADAGYFTRLDAGIYFNDSIVFNMPGDWRMELILYDQDYNEIEKVKWDEYF